MAGRVTRLRKGLLRAGPSESLPHTEENREAAKLVRFGDGSDVHTVSLILRGDTVGDV